MLITSVMLFRWATGSHQFLAHRVAHAGGAVEGNTYTNSFEALDQNLKIGFKYFEIDLLFTEDGELVCLHDWKANFKQSFGYLPSQRLSLAEFETAVESAKFKNCTLNGLADWLADNTGATVITDIRGGDNADALVKLANAIPNASRRVIPQIYQPEEIAEIIELGFDKFIWTLYRFGGDNTAVVERVTELKQLDIPFAITMPTRLARTDLPSQLQNLGVPSYVHTINVQADADVYFNNGVTEIYTDFLVPSEL